MTDPVEMDLKMRCVESAVTLATRQHDSSADTVVEIATQLYSYVSGQPVRGKPGKGSQKDKHSILE